MFDLINYYKIVLLGLQEPYIYLPTALIFGLCVGSFINAAAWRIPRRMHELMAIEIAEVRDEPIIEDKKEFSLMGTSRCPHCASPIKPYHNVPVLGWLILKGKCNDCGAKISPRYPLVEALCGAAYLSIALSFGPTLVSVGLMAFIGFVLLLSIIDIDWQLLPDDLVYPLMWLGLLFSVIGTFASPEKAIIGAVIGYLSLWVPATAFKVFAGREGMGQGDFKLVAAFGAWFGPGVILPAVMVASILATAVGLVLRLSKGESAPFAFGPFLTLGAVVYAVFGTRWMDLFMGTMAALVVP